MTLSISHHRHRSLLLKVLDRHLYDNLRDPGSLSLAERAEREELMEIQEQLTQAVYAPENVPVVVEPEPILDEMGDEDDEEEDDAADEVEVEQVVVKSAKKRKR